MEMAVGGIFQEYKRIGEVMSDDIWRAYGEIRPGEGRGTTSVEGWISSSVFS